MNDNNDPDYQRRCAEVTKLRAAWGEQVKERGLRTSVNTEQAYTMWRSNFAPEVHYKGRDIEYLLYTAYINGHLLYLEHLRRDFRGIKPFYGEHEVPEQYREPLAGDSNTSGY